ncbi:sugar ABC transporter ATP-binding protein [Petroclostridium sp. X23]|uniref:sugar ABC transporter ATP-binding protein n=1 Tax=Petroclostridium sp. X23 TaxID=3045146 RepID=UPI0024AD7193|nr:sugar ABC transporter ATP-binding protein [Petroclostridium sp. X23]WHH57970.1 sugar ABC transporter ATP-binding protein [Petroclostridium sp. X23]
MEKNKPLLKTSGISKRFGVVQALSNVEFELFNGEVHALMGENGAGKSTLAKIISGVETPDDGCIEFEGEKVSFSDPGQAINSGISMVMQEFNLFPDLSVYENVFMGHKDIFKSGFIIKKQELIKRTYDLLKLFNMENQINPVNKVVNLSVAEQQIIEILRSVSYDSKVIILDEPTAALSSNETERLFSLIRKLKAQGVAFIIVSHRFNEIFEISDRITVLRDGSLIVKGEQMKNMTEKKLINAMVGREIKEFYGEKKEKPEGVVAKKAIKVDGICDATGYLKGISFEAYEGEILGIAGLVGAGRTELVRCIFGADKRSKGKIYIDGNEYKGTSPTDAVKARMAMVPENRKTDGLILEMQILLNSLITKSGISSSSRIRHKNERQDCLDMIDKLRIKTAHYRNPVSSLSGGNQQKVVLSKWLLANPKILILDEPTRGIDIGAKAEIYNIIHEVAAQGMCIILVSSELPEIIGMCDRILILKDGALAAEIDQKDATEELIIEYASFGGQERSQSESNLSDILEESLHG